MRKLSAYLMASLVNAKFKMNKFISEEKGAVDIVAVVVLIGIAVLLAIVFKEQIGTLLTRLLNTITTNATDVVETNI